MGCWKCQGLLVECLLVDYEESSLPVRGWRCLNCGAISDALILERQRPLLAAPPLSPSTAVRASYSVVPGFTAPPAAVLEEFEDINWTRLLANEDDDEAVAEGVDDAEEKEGRLDASYAG